MKREASSPRPNFEAEAKKIGFDYAYADGEPYWEESARYVFSLGEIEDRLEATTAELNALCLSLVEEVVKQDDLMRRLKIPECAFDVIRASWIRRDPSLYGRFDFAYDGKSDPKLLEFNADTPTSLYESSVVQWHWLQSQIARGELPPDADQFNSLHEKLVARFGEVARVRLLHLCCMSKSAEDAGTTAYLAECAREAGLATKLLDISGIGLRREEFVDPDLRKIELLFKLYPWEWIFADPFGKSPAVGRTRFVEPPWRMILSNKGALALLWDMAPGHKNLLPCYFEDDPRAQELGAHYARKPLYSREGADVELIDGGCIARGETDGYGQEGYVRQALCPLPVFDGRRPVLGCWLVGDAPAGLGIREDRALITSNRSRFAPHAIVG
ncbi:glutathionylspermidine synthase family protein [Methylocystis sp.]|uniref:glutathionylspermidine synthase family protein n=1 Tax=Methylocystis sp. TaxID=1911079 RepID=UPI002736591B|nr:glutathionylspermidine synthase family protein [Methylocystis sp.]MDP3552648.1 glutathionylspermidine synthase family protein [Methylocystis sp.]